MSKKQKVAIKKDEDFEALDRELDSALVNLRDVTERVAGLLDSIESPGPSGTAEAAEKGAGAPEATGPVEATEYDAT